MSSHADSPARIALPDADATAALGARLASFVQAGEAVLLDGPLGAGKTTLARGFLRAWLDTPEEAPSPTYTLVQRYEGARGMVSHMDLYRLRASEEVDELGLEDALLEGVCLVEWAEKLDAARRPRHSVDVRLALVEGGRIAALAPQGRLKERWHGF